VRNKAFINRIRTVVRWAMSRPDVLAGLAPREREVLNLRYDAEANEIRALDDVGLVFCITRERVRALEAKVVKKLLEAHEQEACFG
jgi:RNA polymerase primary sigma factor